MIDTPEYPPAHPAEKVLNSDVLRFINLKIEQAVANIQMRMSMLDRRFEDVKAANPERYIGSVRTRCSYEQAPRERDGVTVMLRYSPEDLDRIATLSREIMALQDEVRRLMRDKLALFNDYDFTHGDPAEQLAVFGPAT